MIVQIPDLVRMVRVRLNLDAAAPPLFPDEARLPPVDVLIASIIPEAVRDVVSALPVDALGDICKDFSDEGIYWHDAEECIDGFCGHVLLPADFMRLVAFRMSDWTCPVTEITETGRSGVANSRISGIRGNCERPACTYSMLAEGMALNFHSCRTPAAQIAVALYCARPQVDRNGGIELPSCALHDVATRAADIAREIISSNRII